MRQMGHATPHMTLGVYAAAMDWSEGEPERLRALVEGREMPAVMEAAAASDALVEGDVALATGEEL
jgi:hypothetical protein